MSEVQLVGVGINRSLEVPEGCDVAGLRALADLNPDLSIRINGSAAAEDAPVPAGSTVALTAPSVKHGA